MKYITLDLSVGLDDIISAIDKRDAELIILSIDLAMADYEFTERIAKRLIMALSNECNALGKTFDINELAPTKKPK